MSLRHLVVCVAILASMGAAQCTVGSVAFATVSPLYSPAVTGSYNAATCEIRITVMGTFLPNGYVADRYIAVGVQLYPVPIGVPPPFSNWSPPLYLQPLFVLTGSVHGTGGSNGTDFTFSLPPGIGPLTVYVQGAHDTWTFSSGSGSTHTYLAGQTIAVTIL